MYTILLQFYSKQLFFCYELCWVFETLTLIGLLIIIIIIDAYNYIKSSKCYPHL